MLDLRHRKPSEPDHFQEDMAPAKLAIQKIINDGGVPKSGAFDDEWKAFKKYFSDAQFQGKCGYCETRIRGGYSGDVEHIHPKAALDVYENRGDRSEDFPPKRKKSKTTKPAFWWLAYDWDNYLFSCNRCNNWKANQFPIEPQPDVIQQGTNYIALLLNPYKHDPTRHFDWDQAGGIRAQTKQGQATIDVCGLDRKYLELERRRVAEKVLQLLDDLLVARKQNNALAFKQTAKRLVMEGQESNAYTAMVRSLIENQTGKTYAAWQAKYLP